MSASLGAVAAPPTEVQLFRGRAYLANLSNEAAAQPKIWVVVSNNGRNKGLENALAVRVTTTNKYTDLPSVVLLPDNEIVHGWVRCDDLTTIWEDEPIRELGGLTSAAMRVIESGLRGALGM